MFCCFCFCCFVVIIDGGGGSCGGGGGGGGHQFTVLQYVEKICEKVRLEMKNEK